jgi:hypothetical protein
MNKTKKRMYVLPLISGRRVLLEQGIAQGAANSVILENDSISQENDWGTENSTDSSEGGVWVAF